MGHPPVVLLLRAEAMDIWATRPPAAAETNAATGGTCFLVGKPVEGAVASDGGPAYFLYGVTNFHVAWSARSSVIRLNRRDGKRDMAFPPCPRRINAPEELLYAAETDLIIAPRRAYRLAEFAE